jgi:glyoxylase-like metal-dependent hydrolase (beta-lactamase superfamily II)
MRKRRIAGISIAFLGVAIFFGQQKGQVALSGLELAVDKTDIERMPIRLNEKFSPYTQNYTATVEASYTEHILISPKVSSNEYSSIEINGIEVKPDEPHKVKLNAGDNRFRIVVTAKGGDARNYQLTVTRKDMSKEYWSEPIGKGMWRIQDFGGFIGNEDMYLIEGKDRAILFDTGMGRGDLAGYVRSLTKMPVDVAITHGNRDHFLQVDQFPNATVYMSNLDVTRLPPELVTPKFKWVKNGDVIDIGAGRKYEVIEVPGHSLGCVLYVDFVNRIAVTGDAISSGSMVYMFAPTCAALDQYMDGLRKAEARLQSLVGLTLLPGHHYQEKTPLQGAAGKKLITDMRIAAEKVLAGELDGIHIQTVRDGRTIELRQARFGLAGLWYNPNNLVSDPAALSFLKVQTGTGKAVIPRPIFSSLQTSYTGSVSGDVAQVEVTPTAYWPNHRRISVNGKPAKSGAVFFADLQNGENRFDIAVTSDTNSVRTYTIVITRGNTAPRVNNQ